MLIYLFPVTVHYTLTKSLSPTLTTSTMIYVRILTIISYTDNPNCPTTTTPTLNSSPTQEYPVASCSSVNTLALMCINLASVRKGLYNMNRLDVSPCSLSCSYGHSQLLYLLLVVYISSSYPITLYVMDTPVLPLSIFTELCNTLSSLSPNNDLY